MGINEFADMTVEELHNRYFSGKLRAPKRDSKSVPRLRQTHQLQADLPKEVDWNAKGLVSASID